MTDYARTWQDMGNWGMNGTPYQLPDYTNTAQLVPQQQYGYMNPMDLTSDSYRNSGLPNAGGMSYGQSMGGNPSITAGGNRSFMDSMLGGKNADGTSFNGWGGAAIQAGTAIFNAYMGMKQYGLAKEQFKFNKDMTTRNFNAQANLTNSHLADRQATRRAAGENVADPATYMSQYGVKPI